MNETDMIITAVKEAITEEILIPLGVDQDVIDKVNDLPREEIEPYFCSTNFQKNEEQPD